MLTYASCVVTLFELHDRGRGAACAGAGPRRAGRGLARLGHFMLYYIII